ncbi:hypothetical protein GGR21_003295 [Dysgonomonas hofstadii]|uniref:DUF4199 domain-containing protein n=1 Tax=Dysgonomonas hofstadii TaxID=637886 RepID=A0A840CTA7_9BACT|nr:DUF4199 domain-containing protein [Dysgonomonas hofstadii]MBB4037378.1 hypothetical protein [Dysgonomonas hofstadii]
MMNSPDIKEKGTTLLRYAMHYGMILGLFWAFKYLFRIGAGFSDHIFIYVFYLLNVGTFLMIYIFTFKFKNADPDNPRGILSCIAFVTLVCFFASFFESTMMYAHFKLIDPGYFYKMTEPMVEMVNNLSFPPEEEEPLRKFFMDLVTGKPLYIVSNFIGNTILGLILGLMMGLLINSQKK